MADWQLECLVPRIFERNDILAVATAEFGSIALKWRALAEQRYDHFIELQRSGRWKHFYEYPEFIRELRAAAALAGRWADIAPTVMLELELFDDAPQAPSTRAKAA